MLYVLPHQTLAGKHVHQYMVNEVHAHSLASCDLYRPRTWLGHRDIADDAPTSVAKNNIDNIAKMY